MFQTPAMLVFLFKHANSSEVYDLPQKSKMPKKNQALLLKSSQNNNKHPFKHTMKHTVL